jgi:hypothetical protein
VARKYARDNRGRFASTGTGATARGGRLKTAAGNKRATQTIQAGSRAGVIGKPAPRSSIGSVGARLAARDRAAGRGDGAAVNISLGGARGKRLDAEISRNVKAQQVASRAADKTRNKQFKSEQSRAKKLREVHVAGIAKAKGISPAQVESALKAQPPSVQIKAVKNWVKENRAKGRR